MDNKTYECGRFCVQNDIFDRNISGNAKLVYTYLSRCADCFGKSWPAHKTIAVACGISVTSVKIALIELVEEKIVTLSHQYRVNGGKSSNLYMITNKAKANNFWVSADIFAQSVSAKAKLVYMYFCRCSNAEGTCFPAHKTIAEKCQMAISTCRKAIKELLDGALVNINARARKDNGQTSNLYTVVEAVVQKVEEVIEKVKDAAVQAKEKVQETICRTEKSNQKGYKKVPKKVQWSKYSREHSQYIAGGLLKYAYERTKLKLRKYITKE